MAVLDEVQRRLQSIPNLQVNRNHVLAQEVRFAIGGPADLFVTTGDRAAWLKALAAVRESGIPWTLIGGGTNLLVADEGVRGAVLRFDGRSMRREGDCVVVEAGAVLQDLVDFTIEVGLRGLETLTGIPGSVGGAVYGNAGAYGHSLHEIVESVEYAAPDGVHALANADCGFGYRESRFKRRKDWVVLSTVLRMPDGDAAALREKAAGIRKVRDAKFPPSMRCAGSFFKNCFYDALPPQVRTVVPGDRVKEGKVPSAWFLEQVGAKGRRRGGIHIADYHANTPYNDGAGTAADVTALIAELKRDVRDRFGFDLEEEVQYVGFDGLVACVDGGDIAAGSAAEKHGGADALR